MWFRKPKVSSVEAARRLRELALFIAAVDLAIEPGLGHTHVWGVLMEIGSLDAVATLASFADGTARLHVSNGRGVITVRGYRAVREIVAPFIAAADAQRAEFAPAREYPMPPPGRVRFYVRTFDGIQTAEANERDMLEHLHPLSPVFHLGRAVITAVREASTRERRASIATTPGDVVWN